MVDEFKRLEQHRLTQRHLQALHKVDRDTEFTLVLLNARSLEKRADNIVHDPLITKADIICITKTRNARRPYIGGFLPVVCTTDAYRSAGCVGI